MSPALVTTRHGLGFVVLDGQVSSLHLSDGSTWTVSGNEKGFDYHTDGKGATKEFGWRESVIGEDGVSTHRTVYLPDEIIIKPALAGSKAMQEHISRKERI